MVAGASGLAVVCTIGSDQHSFAILGLCMQRWLHDRQGALFADFASRVKCFDAGKDLFSSRVCERTVKCHCFVRSSDCLSD